ncbi:Splicing factor-like protein [Parasponia andersonii]|uniref:Splicing factor-like protein n=1 Tax=Parasponia andersonii TaxID=3476 RepID=A0A2P5B6Q2_PARAD|nr:Splicing factor-like protein [Parasponia andersonii]
MSEDLNLVKIVGSHKRVERNIFEEAPKFIEFFDVRDTNKALKEMNGKQINDKEVVKEFNHCGGHSRKIINAVTTTTYEYPPSLPLATSPTTRKLSDQPEEETD